MRNSLVSGDRYMTTQIWNSERYDQNARFVTDLGMPVLELLNPQPGEHILDVGVLPPAEREGYLEGVRERVKPHLCDAQGNWTADHVRLRFEAHLRS